MEMKETTSNSAGLHYLDIHEVLPEEEDEEIVGKAYEKPSNRNITRLKESTTRAQGNRSFNKQVSLETGFSVLKGQAKGKDQKNVLPRSGRSLGRFGSAQGIGGEGRKGDFDIFRTKSTLGKQNSMMLPLRKESNQVESQKNDGGPGGVEETVNRSVPAGRYFAALTGPELDQVKDHEDILLPKDEKWPFLLRFPINCFGICLGLSSQAILWRALATSPATKFLHITPYINLAIWLLSLAVLLLVSITYALKCIFYFEAVRREYFHPIRVNFFFAPWVVCMFLAIGAPSVIAPERLHPAIWCTFMAPVIFLELKIYGQWLSGGKRRLCKVVNPSSHLSVVGNFVGAILACRVGWEEAAKFLWAIGFAHYLVVFVTLYQRLPTTEALPKELHPVYSMFIAVPSAASIAWGSIYGEFDEMSRTCFFIALFLYISLVVRINFFRGFQFSVAWWSYTFPMTTVSLATIKYAEQVPSVITKSLALSLSFMSTTMVSVLLVSTLLHAFVWHTLFPNDLAIAITEKRQGKEKKPMKGGHNIRRWAKYSSLPFASTIKGNNNSVDKESDREKEMGH